jgi:hypothetical protein
MKNENYHAWDIDVLNISGNIGTNIGLLNCS